MRLQTKLADLCKRFHIDTMYAFGSRAQEAKKCLQEDIPLDNSSPSDLDIGVKTPVDVSLTFDAKVAITQELEDLFDVFRVDLVDLSQADPFLAADVIRGERLFCRNEVPADEYELYILRRAGDLAYLERKRLDIIMARHTGDESKGP